jgi:hypothetical protein
MVDDKIIENYCFVCGSELKPNKHEANKKGFSVTIKNKSVNYCYSCYYRKLNRDLDKLLKNFNKEKLYFCSNCEYFWNTKKKIGTPSVCPNCRSKEIQLLVKLILSTKDPYKYMHLIAKKITT